ncbi:MAG: hypothetical protein II937_17450, partial [Bacteroidales bacterium]|nr:hypothetical protein [Bacteroidales bacterium]
AMQRNSTTLETLEKIAKYFRVSVGVFFGEEDIFTPIRNSFDNFDTEVKKASNYIETTLLYYVPELKNNIVSVDYINDAWTKVSSEVVNIIEFSMNKLVENHTCKYLMTFSFDEILKMRNTGIISKDVADLVLIIQNPKIFENKKLRIKLGAEGENNFWEKVIKGIERSKQK